MADPVNYDDPCARAAALRASYYRLVQGEQEQTIRYLGNGVDREVRYTPAKIELLMSALRTAEAECSVQQGTPPTRRRFAIQAGMRRY